MLNNGGLDANTQHLAGPAPTPILYGMGLGD